MYCLRFQVWLPVCMLLLSGCRQTGMDRTGHIAVIEVVQNLGKYQTIPVSEFVAGLEYIPLETGDDCLIGVEENEYYVTVTATHIFISGQYYCYAFGRDGRFLNRIGNRGQGPGEYSSILGLSMDEKNRTLYLQAAGGALLEYSFDGVFRRSIKIPANAYQLSSNPDNPPSVFSLNNVFFVHDNLFIGHVSNHRGNEKYNFHLFNDSGQVVKSFENHRLFNRTSSIFSPDDRAIKPFRISENMYLKEYANDTLYGLNEQNELIPQFVFDLGKYAYHLEKRRMDFIPSDTEAANRMHEGLIYLPDRGRTAPLVGVPGHIFFSISTFRPNTIHAPFPNDLKSYNARGRALGLYDTVNQKTHLLDTDPDTRMAGLINDLDGGLPFWPRDYTSDNELIDIWQAYQMKEFLTEAYFAAHEIKDPQAHQKLKELLKILKDDDNPVLVIGKLK